MKLDENSADQTILEEIGERIATIRLNRNLTQADLADEAGVSKRTIERLESGESIQTKSLIRLLRLLGLLSRLEILLPESVPSPVAQLKLQGKTRRRASTKGIPIRSKGKAWKWGDKS